ncbi:RNA polymerase II-associated protein 1 [Candida viswanathii]|uniref:RNA polymerase II-associated protein 1 n=1 Tax=Candida viswanathii TaxID=5486 RepID=A0A367YLK8_9ASCO|nr:RNA polymerase II-associated protein 1 [Candida viswanathii]
MSSSTKPQKAMKQDYIAKVRYTNNLPPPPLNPKFIAYNTTDPVSAKQEGEHLMASLFRKENFQNLMERIDDQLGLDLNLINNHGFLSEEKIEAIGKLKYDQLHPKDRVLLRDAGIGRISKNEPGVSFLRRTEYISERPLSKGSSGLSTASEELKNKERLSKDEHFDADSQLAKIEEGFTAANESLYDLKKLKHPRKKHLKAVNAWPLLPDTSMMDNNLFDLKFTGSASIEREIKQQNRGKVNKELINKALESALFKPIRSEEGEWISMFRVDNEDQIKSLYEKLHSTKREQPINLLDEEEEEAEEFKFKYNKNYDMTVHAFQHDNEELAIKFVPADDADTEQLSGRPIKKRKTAYYYPIKGKVDLKKHRASTNSEINKFIRERTFDGINFKLREPTTNELKKMDKVRSEYDPMEYEGEEEEDQEEEEEESSQLQTQAVRNDKESSTEQEELPAEE